MKWFKHISDSLDDPFIFDLINRFGGDGYLVFFGVLEIYSREFKEELKWKLRITRDYLKRKLQKRQDTLVIKILEAIKNSGKWDIEFNGNQIIIFIPKFTELLDEWTKRKLGSCSGATPKILNTDKEVEVDIKEKEIKKEKEKPLPPPKGNGSPPPYQEIIYYLNQETKKSFRHQSENTRKYIRARWNDGFKAEDFKRVIDNLVAKWGTDPKMVDYLRPETMFGSKFESYLNLNPPQKPQSSTKPRSNPVQKCPRCGEEALPGDFFQIKGDRYCPKCPGAKDMAREAAQKAMHLLKNFGK